MTHLEATCKLNPLDLLIFNFLWPMSTSVQFLWNNDHWHCVFFESMTPPGVVLFLQSPLTVYWFTWVLFIPQISVKITGARAPDSTRIRVFMKSFLVTPLRGAKVFRAPRMWSKARREKNPMLFHLRDSEGLCDEILKVISHVHIKPTSENSVFFTITLPLPLLSAND